MSIMPISTMDHYLIMYYVYIYIFRYTTILMPPIYRFIVDDCVFEFNVYKRKVV